MLARVPENARWDCHACGDCCRLYELGPVEPAVVAGLRERQIDAHWEPAGRQPWVEERTGPNGEPGHFFTHLDGHCVFLRDDNLCAIHGLFGAEAKPGFCREYPFHILEDPNGPAAIVRTSCAGFHQSNRDGRPLADHISSVLDLPRMTPVRRFQPNEVVVHVGRSVTLTEFMALEGEMLAAIGGAAVAPDRSLATLRCLVLAKAQPVPDRKRARLATGAVIEGLRRTMHRAATELAGGEDPHRVAFARKAVSMLERALPAMAEEPRPWADDALPYLNVLLRSFLLAKGFSAIGTVAEGLGAWWVQLQLARAAAQGTGPVTAKEASEILVLWTKLVENRAITGILKMARPALNDAFLYFEPEPGDVARDV